MSNWTQRVPGPRELHDVRAAAHDLAEQSKHAGKTGPAFARVAQTLLITTALLSGALTLVHLYKALRPHPPRAPEHERRHSHEDREADGHRPRQR